MHRINSDERAPAGLDVLGDLAAPGGISGT